MSPGELARLIADRAAGHPHPGRFLAAIAGPPGSGKSTLAAAIARELGPLAAVLPMDGFHLDDAILIARGQRARKGAPFTFDARGFQVLLERSKNGENGVFFPLFDREMELSRNAAAEVGAATRIILAEGNYLLLDAEVWRDIAGLFDLTVMLKPPPEELHRRLMARWAHFGKTPEEARAWIAGNDLPNMRAVLDGSLPADVTLG